MGNFFRFKPPIGFSYFALPSRQLKSLRIPSAALRILAATRHSFLHASASFCPSGTPENSPLFQRWVSAPNIVRSPARGGTIQLNRRQKREQRREDGASQSFVGPGRPIEGRLGSRAVFIILAFSFPNFRFFPMITCSTRWEHCFTSLRKSPRR